jgi:hypothetical protein
MEICGCCLLSDLHSSVHVLTTRSSFTVQLGARKWVFLNSSETARELLDRRGRLYISRPEFPVTQDILSGGKRIVMMGHTERWRQLRKIMHQLLMASNVSFPGRGGLWWELMCAEVGDL